MLSPGVWIPLAVAIGLFTVSVVREPRRLRPALYLLIAVQLGVLSLLGDVLDLASRWGDDLTAAWILLGLLLVGVLTVSILGVFLVVNGVTMLRREGRGPATFVSLALGLVVVGYVALAATAVSGTAPRAIAWTFFLGLPLLYLGWVFTAFLLYSSIYLWWNRRWGRPVDAVIALGAGLRRGEEITPLLASRLDRARVVAERSRSAGRDPVIVVSGGQGPDERISEAEAMARYLSDQGVPETHLLREDRSTTTEENLAFSARVLADRAPRRVAVVTNNYHAFRAATLMRGAGLPGYAVGSPTARYFWPSATVREYLALLRDHRWINGVILAVLSLPMLWSIGYALLDGVRR
ncbi:YdcF family protein [Aeromicrobium sp. PE09-221]|uniref:YdcF family protein n=1 Tax=Aeromicrobium sp. PE09-221 TaxID=1898043 RepID=UPI000B3EA842|nr:YdcF family protein [Aeromicrobium sp. PE09-221]